MYIYLKFHWLSSSISVVFVFIRRMEIILNSPRRLTKKNRLLLQMRTIKVPTSWRKCHARCCPEVCEMRSVRMFQGEENTHTRVVNMLFCLCRFQSGIQGLHWHRPARVSGEHTEEQPQVKQSWPQANTHIWPPEVDVHFLSWKLLVILVLLVSNGYCVWLILCEAMANCSCSSSGTEWCCWSWSRTSSTSSVIMSKSFSTALCHPHDIHVIFSQIMFCQL